MVRDSKQGETRLKKMKFPSIITLNKFYFAVEVVFNKDFET
jgi:hypothetical protein